MRNKEVSISSSRLAFACHYALRHLLLSLLVGLVSAAIVFGLWYAAPWRHMQQVGRVYLLVLAVDVVCGPLLTLILVSPKKSHRECWLDLILVVLIQFAALGYGMYSVWAARPVALVFEVDRLVLVTANEVAPAVLARGPVGLRGLPSTGNLLLAGTRPPKNSAEMLRSVMQNIEGISVAQQPDWWLPWGDVLPMMRKRIKPLSELIVRRPQDASVLGAAAQRSGLSERELTYLPLVSSKTLEWVALFDADLKIVGYAPVDGF